MFRAFDKATGELVWEKDLPLRPAASPMTYLYQGRQYLVLAVGAGVEADLSPLRCRCPRLKS